MIIPYNYGTLELVVPTISCKDTVTGFILLPLALMVRLLPVVVGITLCGCGILVMDRKFELYGDTPTGFFVSLSVLMVGLLPVEHLIKECAYGMCRLAKSFTSYRDILNGSGLQPFALIAHFWPVPVWTIQCGCGIHVPDRVFRADPGGGARARA